MKNLKKAIAVTLAGTMMLGALSACGNSSTDNSAGDTDNTSAESESTSTVTASTETSADAVTLQWAYTPPADSQDESWYMSIGDRISELTDGAVTYEYYAGGALGSEKVALEGVASGTINQASISPNVVATVLPEFNALCLPYMFDSAEHFYAVISTDEYYEKMNEIANAAGMQYLGEVFYIPRTIATNTPVYTPDDANGQVIRVMDGTIYTDMMELWGFGSSVIAYGEVYTAVQQGTIDGIENSNDGNLSMTFYEVISYSTQTNHVYHGQAAFMNLEQWNALSEETQEAIHQAWTENMAEAIEVLPDLYAEQETQMEENGVELIYLTDEQRQEWIDASVPLYEQYKEVIGEEFYDWFTDLVEEKRPAE